MRIIAGEFRSRKLSVPAGFTTRPMPDRVRESVFSMLGERIKDAAVVDLFAGSGAIGLEALSRGARTCLFVERDKAAAASLERNIQMLGLAGRATLIVGDALGMSIPARCPRPVDLVFFDPPYPLVGEPVGWSRVRAQATALAAFLAESGFLILRTPQPFMIEAPVATGAPAPGDPAGPPAPPPRAQKRKKYRRERPRWEEIPLAESFQGMRRGRGVIGGPHADARRTAAPPQPAAPVNGDEGGEDDDGVEVREAHAEPAPGVPTVPGDLAIPGCRGPETHPYGKTAVHWYMRDR